MIEGVTNSSTSLSSARQPRGQVSINSTPVPFESFEVDNNTFYVGDTFRVDIPANSLPTGMNAIDLSYTDYMIVEILAGFPKSPSGYSNAGLDQLIYGQVDDISYDISRGLITLAGRDLTSRFIDNKTTEKFTNQKSSDIANTLAARRNLNPIVTSTSTIVGKFYEVEHARLTKEMSEWDLLNYLAQEEGFVVYVKGNNLIFGPLPQTSQTPYGIQFNQQFYNTNIPTSNIIDLKLSRNLTLANDVVVIVRSWNQKKAAAFTVTATATHNKNNVIKGAPQPTGEAQTYTYTFPNLDKEQATQKAQQLLQSISQHELRIRATMPADNVLNKTSTIQLSGTGTQWDQIYYPDSILREMKYNGGYTMVVEAKNHSPVSQTIV
jgi:phage protein D